MHTYIVERDDQISHLTFSLHTNLTTQLGGNMNLLYLIRRVGDPCRADAVADQALLLDLLRVAWLGEILT